MGAPEEADTTVTKYINIVRAHQLQKVALTKKEYKAFFKAMWKKVIKAKKAAIMTAAGFEDDYVAPKDKKAAKAELEEYLEELEDHERKIYDDLTKEMKTFEKRYKKITAFSKKEINGNFDDYEFYLPQGAILGECLIIPARWVLRPLLPCSTSSEMH